MCRSEYQDLHERKFRPSPTEEAQEKTAANCNKRFKGQLSYTTEEWLKKNKMNLS